MPPRSSVASVDSADETESFAALCDSFDGTERPLGSLSRKERRNGSEGEPCFRKASEAEHRLSGREPPVSFFRFLLFVFFHLAGESVLISDRKRAHPAPAPPWPSPRLFRWAPRGERTCVHMTLRRARELIWLGRPLPNLPPASTSQRLRCISQPP